MRAGSAILLGAGKIAETFPRGTTAQRGYRIKEHQSGGFDYSTGNLA